MQSDLSETPRERFLRNHVDCIGRMKVARTMAIRAGRTDDADLIQRIIDAWERIAEKARQGDV